MSSDLLVTIPPERMVRRQDVRDVIALWMRGGLETASAVRSIVRLGYTAEESEAAMTFIKGGTN